MMGLRISDECTKSSFNNLRYFHREKIKYVCSLFHLVYIDEIWLVLPCNNFCFFAENFPCNVEYEEFDVRFLKETRRV